AAEPAARFVIQRFLPPLSLPPGRARLRRPFVATQQPLELSVSELFALSALRRADDRVRDLGCAVAVLERRPVWRHVRAVGDRRQEVVELVDERLAPADDVA